MERIGTDDIDTQGSCLIKRMIGKDKQEHIVLEALLFLTINVAV